MANIEEKVKELYKQTLDHLGVTRWGKNEAPNVEISWKIQRPQMPLL